MKISNHLKRTALVTSLALSASFATQAADAPVELRFAHWVPAQHALARLGIIPGASRLKRPLAAPSKSAFSLRNSWVRRLTTTTWCATALRTWPL